MSYILDALKKAERERAFDRVPDLGVSHEPAPAKARSGPLLTGMGIALGLLTIAIVTWALLRTPVDDTTMAEGPETQTPAAEQVAAPIAAPPVAPATPQAGEPTEIVPAPTTPGDGVAAAPTPAERPLRPLPLPSAPPAPEAEPAPVAEMATETPPRGTVAPAPPSRVADLPSPVVDRPAADPAAVTPAPSPRAEPTPPEWSRLPVWPLVHRDLSRHVDGGLVVNAHVYTPQPAGRFVLLNMKKYVEGDRLAEGPTLEEITREGVVLEVPDGRFRVRAD
jgi:general secretion pathway protein B